MTMKLKDVMKILQAEALWCEESHLEKEVYSACGSDLMSDVLAYVKEQGVLLTGLVNPQVLRTAELMNMQCIVFVRGKTPDDSLLELAKDCDIAVMRTEHRMFSACGRLYAAGLKGDND